MSRKPVISLCMIARNEEKWLKMSLGSAKQWVDEIILVDTGSQDRTMELAREFGARIFQHRWQNSFALHRNQSLEYARGDWLLILDADEKLDQKTAPFLAGLTQIPECDAYFVDILHLSSDGGHTLQSTPRFFRNNAGLQFKGNIHETLIGLKGKCLRSPLRLIHHGFAQGPQVMRQKNLRNLALIRNWVEKEPKNPTALTYLAQTQMIWPETAQQALTAGLKALELAKARKTPARMLVRIYHPIWISLTQLERHGEVVLWANECRNSLPDYPDSYFSLTWAHLEMGHWELVREAAQKFMNLQDHWRKNTPSYPYTQNLTLNLRHVVIKRWILADMNLPGAEKELEFLFTKLLEEPKGPQAARDLLADLSQKGKPGLLERLKQIIHSSS